MLAGELPGSAPRDPSRWITIAPDRSERGSTIPCSGTPRPPPVGRGMQEGRLRRTLVEIHGPISATSLVPREVGGKKSVWSSGRWISFAGASGDPHQQRLQVALYTASLLCGIGTAQFLDQSRTCNWFVSFHRRQPWLAVDLPSGASFVGTIRYAIAMSACDYHGVKNDE
jgi:hypothetical protein